MAMQLLLRPIAWKPPPFFTVRPLRFAPFRLADACEFAMKARKGFSVPTPIQRKTIPVIMDDKDVVGMARTGSGFQQSHAETHCLETTSLLHSTALEVCALPVGGCLRLPRFSERLFP
jgi:hypothetical protein